MLTAPRPRRELPLWADATDAEWGDWKWQLRNRITTGAELRRLLQPTAAEEEGLRAAGDAFRFGITPHYASLLDPGDPDCPLRRQVVPHGSELAVAEFEMRDPLHEDAHSPFPGLTHRYPDRVLLLLTHECALYCRYCTRRRIVGDGAAPSAAALDRAIAYIRDTPAVRDVLISGGDPLTLSDRRLESVIARLRAIPHVEVIRIGTRVPVVMPQRVTDSLTAMLRRYHPLWLNTHFNHPRELASPAAQIAMERLADAGIPTGNQTVLLRGINDCPVVMRELVRALVRVRCRPYYLYNCDLSEGLAHFRTPVETGIALVEALRGHLPGYAVPTFVVDAPGGGGKVPLGPDYLVHREPGRVTLRNYEGILSEYREGEAVPQVPGAPCALCGTDHAAVDCGPAARIWRTNTEAAVEAVSAASRHAAT